MEKLTWAYSAVFFVYPAQGCGVEGFLHHQPKVLPYAGSSSSHHATVYLFFLLIGDIFPLVGDISPHFSLSWGLFFIS